MDTFQGMTMYDDWRLVPVGAWRAVQRVTRRALIGSRCIKKNLCIFLSFIKLKYKC